MEPLLLGEGSRHRAHLGDLALELAQWSAGFRRSLPQSLVPSLATLVRSMNCYYSNLIEGHDTHPIDIERALRGDYSNDAKKRDLQLEAQAHIAVQQWIDEGALNGRVVMAEAICEIHRRFYEALPEDLLWAEDPATHEQTRVIPGVLRVRDALAAAHRFASPSRPLSLHAGCPDFFQNALGSSERSSSRVAASRSLVGAPPPPTHFRA